MRRHHRPPLFALAAALSAAPGCGAHHSDGFGLSPQEEEAIEVVTDAMVCLTVGTCTLVSPRIDPRVWGPALHAPLPARGPTRRPREAWKA